MGGRLDATNVVDPLLSIVTDISLDHMEWLGPTISAIAREKAGILRPGGTMITLPQHPEANQVLGEVATELGVRGVSAVRYRAGQPEPAALHRRRVGRHHQGRFAARRSAPAAEHCPRHRRRSRACRARLISRNARRNRKWDSPSPAGLDASNEFHRPKKNQDEWILDVAHNPAGAWALRAAVRGILEAHSLGCSSSVACATSPSTKWRRFSFLFSTR
jgi:dihydrofolate synthase / folylpolyglutamate synthase